MQKKYRRAFFIFRRDLRLEDNTGLIFALQAAETVIPSFIFTPEQIEHNPYRSDHCLHYMVESLEDLDQQLREKGSRLYLFQGRPEDVVQRCLRELQIDVLVINRDYTPYSISRDAQLEAICREQNIAFYSCDDALLHPPEDTLKSDGKPYTVFTPFFRNASKKFVPPAVKNRAANYFCGSMSCDESRSLYARIKPELSGKPLLRGGRGEALSMLAKLSSLHGYGELRDFPARDATTRLSACLKFTLLSPREVHAAIIAAMGPGHELIRSLYWRDFFTVIAYYFPHVFTGAFHKKYDAICWSHDEDAFSRWCEGSTGFPIVDAGMREMNETGYMHNRVRMITASFLVKDLHIDWRKGEKYFANTLIDYDPAVNNGNWQWAASTGCDAQPYFRIFNPWLQQKKFDPQCIYIKKWIPELGALTPKAIHQWYQGEQPVKACRYPAPIVDHKEEAAKSRMMYG